MGSAVGKWELAVGRGCQLMGSAVGKLLLAVGSGCQVNEFFYYWEVDGSWEGLPIRSGRKAVVCGLSRRFLSSTSQEREF